MIRHMGEGRYSVDDLGLPDGARAVGVGCGLASKNHLGGFVGVVVGDDLTCQPQCHVAVGTVGQGLAVDG